jgi:hypothetical protein
VRGFEATDSQLGGAGERTRLSAEELGFEQLIG